jgi:hypothetical protein
MMNPEGQIPPLSYILQLTDRCSGYGNKQKPKWTCINQSDYPFKLLHQTASQVKESRNKKAARLRKDPRKNSSSLNTNPNFNYYNQSLFHSLIR